MTRILTCEVVYVKLCLRRCRRPRDLSALARSRTPLPCRHIALVLRPLRVGTRLCTPFQLRARTVQLCLQRLAPRQLLRQPRRTSDAGLILVRELEEHLGLQAILTVHLRDTRQWLNTQFRLPDLLRQSVYGRVAGDAELNDSRPIPRSCSARRRRGTGARR